jgi:hypothetical protein
MQVRLKDESNETDAARRSEHVYFCSGCGGVLLERFRGRFHKECLKRDKRRRVRERREREQNKLNALLQRTKCPKCGSSLGLPPDNDMETSVNESKAIT